VRTRSRRQHQIRHPHRTPRIPHAPRIPCSYQILVGDSSRSLPLSGSVTVGSTITTGVLSPDGTGAASTAAAPATVKENALQAALTAPASPAIKRPGGMESPRGAAARLQLTGTAGLRYTAAGLPPGLTISPAGLISGAGRRRGTSTVTVTGRTAAGVTTTATFVWTVS
jgi:beta-glucosidase